ncbi:MAG: beta-hydroxyacyl-ACP dehydratase [Planctomycetota bacterium]
MHFSLIDRVLEREDDRLVAVKMVSNAEEYLRDHFPTFPVLPGVMMIEALVQASRELLGAGDRWVLREVKALKYGSFVKPGESLLVEVVVAKRGDDGTVTLKGTGTRRSEGAEDAVAVSGRVVLGPVSVWSGVSGP